MSEIPEPLCDYLACYPVHVRDLMGEGRRFLLQLLGPISELWYDATAAVCTAVTHTGEPKGNFVNLAAYPNHVTLVFMFGALLDDPRGILKGEGKQVRHLRLAGIETLRDDYVVGLILQAERNAPRPAEPIQPMIVTKVYSGPKRRPMAIV